MSYWFYKKEKSGKKSLYAVDFPYVAIMPLLGMIAALLFPRYLNLNNLIKDCFYLVSAGFFLILISKISLFSKGIWNSWGPNHMSKPFKFLYITGYMSIVIGILLIIAIVHSHN
jgi:hypothetical protein